MREWYFVKCYVFVYGAMIVGGIAFFLILMLPAATLTFLSIKSSKDKKT